MSAGSVVIAFVLGYCLGNIYVWVKEKIAKKKGDNQ